VLEILFGLDTMSNPKMPSLSQSLQRFSFQKEGYLKRCTQNNHEPNTEYLDFFDSFIEQHKDKWEDPNVRNYNLEYDLLTTQWILEKVRNSDTYAQHLYAALCNNEFQKFDITNVFPLLKNQTWHCSWRYAGGIIADMQQTGDYIDWYCSGIEKIDQAVSEGVVTDEIKEDLKKLSWRVIKNKDDNF